MGFFPYLGLHHLCHTEIIWLHERYSSPDCAEQIWCIKNSESGAKLHE